LWGFGLLNIGGLALEPLAIIALFPLCIRGIALVIHWQSCLTSASTAMATPFARDDYRGQALEHTAATLGRPFMTALCIDGAALFALTRSDVPALQALGYLSTGWMTGLLVAVWTVLPLWSVLILTRTATRSWGARLSTWLSSWLRALFQTSFVAYGGSALVVLLGLAAAVHLQAGRQMLGTTLFYDSHPFNRAFSLVNDKFIGGNQLIVIAQAPSEAAFRDPKALEALEAFQHHMAEDAQFGGAMAITGLTKSITRMFHEDVPKWEIIPDDIKSAGQVVFRIISSAATPSEIERFLSPDYHTTAMTFFYKNYSPEIVDRVLDQARSFIARQQNGVVQFRVGGGILGVLAAVHTAVELAYWRTIGFLILFAGIGGLISEKSFRSVLSLLGGILFVQAVLLSVSWLGRIDFNVYTLPAFVLCAGAVLIPISTVLTDNAEPQLSDSSVVATSLTLAAAATPWLFSSLRLQAEIGGLFIYLAVALAVIPFVFRRVQTARQNIQHKQ
jgi:predicted RND superfamily exporter protein